MFAVNGGSWKELQHLFREGGFRFRGRVSSGARIFTALTGVFNVQTTSEVVRYLIVLTP